VQLTPVQASASAFTPSTTRFKVAAGYQLSVTVDPATIAALQATLPNVSTLLIIFDPNPALLNDVEAGSLCGGNVAPRGRPFALTLVPKDSVGNTVTPIVAAGVAPSDALVQALSQVQVQLSLPVLPLPTVSPSSAKVVANGASAAALSTPPLNGDFAWLQAVYDVNGFQGYLRPAASFVAPGVGASLGGPFGATDPLSLSGSQAAQGDATYAGASPATIASTSGTPGTSPAAAGGPLGTTAPAGINPLGTASLRVSLADLRGALFLPTTLVPAYVANFDANVHIYSSPFVGATDYGLAGPQFTTFTVVAPQVGSRLYVYNPATDNYGWIDVTGVGPVFAPTATTG